MNYRAGTRKTIYELRDIRIVGGKPYMYVDGEKYCYMRGPAYFNTVTKLIRETVT